MLISGYLFSGIGLYSYTGEAHPGLQMDELCRDGV
jgi:hypothetical protein